MKARISPDKVHTIDAFIVWLDDMERDVMAAQVEFCGRDPKSVPPQYRPHLRSLGLIT